jgi:ligand-binding sensor domain-containing protein/signal transduction histidine kinase
MDVTAQIYPLKSYSTADGLPQASVGEIFQDSRGFLWFGTHGGVGRYDGVTFVNYLIRGEERSIINHIWEDEEGTIWFATHGNGVARLSYGDSTCSWMKAADGILPDDYAEIIFKDRSGNIWIGTNGGILLLSRNGGHAVFDTASGLPHNRVRGIVQDEQGEMWFGTSGGLVKARFREDGSLQTTVIHPSPVRSLITTRDHDLIVGTRRLGAFRYSSGKSTVLVSSGKIEALCEDTNGRIWMGATTGVYIHDGNRLTHIGNEDGLESQLVGAICEDREGTIWIGTGDGVMKLSSRRFANFGIKHGLGSSIVISLCIDAKGTAWAGTYNGLTRFARDGTATKLAIANGLLDFTVYAIEEGPDGAIWVGTGRGLNVYQGLALLPTAIHGLDGGVPISAVHHGMDGSTWLGARGKIIQIVERQVVRVLDNEAGIPEDIIIPALMMDREGGLWIATSNSGIGYLRDGKVSWLTEQDGLLHRWVHSIIQDRRGRLWITTHAGVTIWNGHSLERFAPSEPAFENAVVYSVMEDKLGRLWFGTEHGAYGWSDSLFQHLDSQDGLAADIVHVIAEDPEGNLWFGTHDGLSRLDRENVGRRVPLPSVYLERILTGIEGHPIVNNADLSYRDRTLMFKFNALSFVDEKNLRFQWMLEGFDKSWFHPQKQRQVRYTNLEPGTYTFFVRAQNRNGNWSTPASFSFTVLPPFWQTWWFIVSSIVAIVTIASAAYRYRVNHLLRIERMRTRIATDLHDDIGASLSRIALFSEVAKEEASKTSPRLYEMSQKIGDNARELLDAVGTLVWSIDPRHDRFQDVVTHMKNFAQEMFSAKGIDYSLEVQPDVENLDLPLEQRKNLLLVFKELVNNVVRHSECKAVRVSMLVRNGILEMSVADDGRGLPHQAAENGHGLANMKARSESIGGTFAIHSVDGKGTIATLQLPLSK